MTYEQEAYYNLAREFERKKDYENALDCLKKIGEVALVLEIIGEYYFFGKGCVKDINNAREFFKKAAELGNIDAMCNYAFCIEEPNEKKEWYTKAALLGCGYAMNMVGIIIEKYNMQCEETPYEWYVRAEKAGSIPAKYNVAMWTTDMNMRARLLSEAANAGCEPARNVLEKNKGII